MTNKEESKMQKENRNTEKELQESEKKYRELFENLDDGIIIHDVDGNIIDANRKALELFGYKKSDMLETNIFELCPEYEVEKLKHIFGTVSDGKKTKFEMKLKRKDGNIFPAEISSSLFEIGGKRYIQNIVRDVTTQKEFERNITELNEMLKLLNKILRHDILNDLNAIDGAIEIYRETRDEKVLDVVSKAINRAVEFIKEVRELENLVSHFERLKPVNVRGIIEKVIEKYDTNININICGKCKALADDALSSVIDNIIRNALTHGKTDRIDIEIDELEDQCEIRISDYGIGIPDEVKEKIFEEGFIYGETGQSGLGLYIAEKLIERYGGSIKVEDNRPRGAVFIIRLKRAKD